MIHDLLIRNGDLIDGTGAPRARADLAIDGERISVIRRHDDPYAPDLKAREVIDARGRVVAPGFIDVHTHDDTALIVNPAMAMKASQGVTTVICGNCGASAMPFEGRQLPTLMLLIAKDPAHVSVDFATHAAKVEAARPALNSAFMVGHGTLRMAVMGHDLQRAATTDEIARMRALLEISLRQGAIGFSSGLYYPPAMAATTEEVEQIAEPVGRLGAVYTAHMRDEGEHILASIDETARIGRTAGARSTVISHHKCRGHANFGRMRETLPRIDSLRAGQPLAFDVYPYVASSTALMPHAIDPAERVLVTWSDAVPEAGGRDLAEIAREWGVEPVEAAERLHPAGAIYFSMDEGDVQSALRHPAAMVGSDGLPLDAHPHPRLWGTFPRVLGHYSRDLKLFPLEEAVHRMTGLSARHFNLTDRGELRAGAFADVCIFDPDEVIDLANFENPTRPSRGIDTVLVNGQPVWRNGASTAQRPGRVLRRAGSTAQGDA
ncbi:MAG: N-acyl-D-amino-acid deacylase family protein [Burkholderiales bacterium]